MKKEIKPCPFCGGRAGVWCTPALGYRIRCNKCDAASTEMGSVNGAINRWNKRAGE